eukprot:646971-Rhodomonas_salina.1
MEESRQLQRCRPTPPPKSKTGFRNFSAVCTSDADRTVLSAYAAAMRSPVLTTRMPGYQLRHTERDDSSRGGRALWCYGGARRCPVLT